jgi:hypothetical protein
MAVSLVPQYEQTAPWGVFFLRLKVVKKNLLLEQTVQLNFMLEITPPIGQMEI